MPTALPTRQSNSYLNQPFILLLIKIYGNYQTSSLCGSASSFLGIQCLGARNQSSCVMPLAEIHAHSMFSCWSTDLRVPSNSTICASRYISAWLNVRVGLPFWAMLLFSKMYSLLAFVVRRVGMDGPHSWVSSMEQRTLPPLDRTPGARFEGLEPKTKSQDQRKNGLLVHTLFQTLVSNVYTRT